MTGRDVVAKLAEGLAGLDSLLARSGFVREDEQAGKGSGGPFATAAFTKGDRSLHIWLRGDSLSVQYRLGADDLDHATFMRELLGPGGANQLPAYAEDSARAFVALRHDLEHFCGDFLDGAGDEFRRCAAAAAHDRQLTGPQRLARIEQQLTKRR